MPNAQIRPSLITGANAKIKVSGTNKILAYAVGVSYGVSIDTIPVETMGRYEVVSHEPISYYVSGSLSIIRYTKAAAEQNPTSIPDKELLPDGNMVDNWVNGHFNPASLINSETFDIEIYQRLGKGEPGDTESEDKQVIKVMNCRLTSKGGGLSKRGYLVEGYDFVGVLQQDEGSSKIGRTNFQNT